MAPASAGQLDTSGNAFRFQGLHRPVYLWTWPQSTRDAGNLRAAESDEFKALQKALRTVTASGTQTDDLSRAFRDYRLRIDDTILRQMGLLPNKNALEMKLVNKLGGFGRDVIQTAVTSGIDLLAPMAGTLGGGFYSLIPTPDRPRSRRGGAEKGVGRRVGK